MYTYQDVLTIRSDLLNKFQPLIKKYQRNGMDLPFDIKKSCEFIEDSINVDQDDVISVDLKYRYLEFEEYKLPFMEGIYMSTDKEFQKNNKMNSIKEKITKYVAEQYSILKLRDPNADVSHLSDTLDNVDSALLQDVSVDDKIKSLLIIKEDIGA